MAHEECQSVIYEKTSRPRQSFGTGLNILEFESRGRGLFEIRRIIVAKYRRQRNNPLANIEALINTIRRGSSFVALEIISTSSWIQCFSASIDMIARRKLYGGTSSGVQIQISSSSKYAIVILSTLNHRGIIIFRLAHPSNAQPSFAPSYPGPSPLVSAIKSVIAKQTTLTMNPHSIRLFAMYLTQ